MRKLIFLIIIGLSLLNYRLYACSCIRQRAVKEEIKYSDAVVVGKIISKNHITLIDSTALKMFGNGNTNTKSPLIQTTVAKYELIITSIFKGKFKSDTIEVYTGLGGGDCGIRFEIGKEYIIYGDKETFFGQINNDWPYPKGNNIIWANICSRTTIIGRSKVDEIKKYLKPRK